MHTEEGDLTMQLHTEFSTMNTVSLADTLTYTVETGKGCPVSSYEKTPAPVLHESAYFQNDLEASPETVPGPQTKGNANVRYAILTVYRRLFSIVFLVNMIAFVIIMTKEEKVLPFVNAAAANLLVSGLARQPFVVNTMYLLICSVPRSAPLRLRRIAAKVYHFGGVHSGCGVASLVWYLGFVSILSKEYKSSRGTTAAILVLSYIILALFLAIIATAYPSFRSQRHNHFELTHRFCGWLVVIFFWPLLILFAENTRQQRRLGAVLASVPAFWTLIITSVAIIQPWLSLRKLQVLPEYISPHAIRLHFSHSSGTFGQGFMVSKHPLRDWHAFATIPDPEGKSFSCLISNAGDWTKDCISTQPERLWKRGVPMYGFAYVMKMFRALVIVATGSGIGPCLAFLGMKNRPPIRVVWQTKDPLKTYGKPIMDLVEQLDPCAVIIDTDNVGRQDMLPIVLDVIEDSKAEAVGVISNPPVTKKLVFDLEARGVPAYGPIFDS